MRMIFSLRQAIPGLLRKLPREIRDLIYGLVLGDATVDITTSLLAETSTLSNGSPLRHARRLSSRGVETYWAHIPNSFADYMILTDRFVKELATLV
jgi:hypothetical protein